MAAQGAILQNHNNELVTCARAALPVCSRAAREAVALDWSGTWAGIEELREKREALQAQIRDEEVEKSKIQQDLQARAV